MNYRTGERRETAFDRERESERERQTEREREINYFVRGFRF